MQISSLRLYEQVAGVIRGQIVSGQLTQGARLPTERDIASAYGVSRNVVREAIRALAKDGLVSVRQGSGTYVSDGTSRALGDSLELALTLGGGAGRLSNLVEIRQIIEPAVAGLAAERASPADIERLRAEVATMERSLEDVDSFITADHRFHIAIANCTQNDLVALMLFPIVDVLNEQRKRLFFVKDSARSAQRYHRKILAAIEKGDAVAATAAMIGHVGQVRRDIMLLDDAATKTERAPRPALTRSDRKPKVAGG